MSVPLSRRTRQNRGSVRTRVFIHWFIYRKEAGKHIIVHRSPAIYKRQHVNVSWPREKLLAVSYPLFYASVAAAVASCCGVVVFEVEQVLRSTTDSHRG